MVTDQGEASGRLNEKSDTEDGKLIDPIEAKTLLSECKEDEPASERVTLRVYGMRWVVLAIVALLNNINTMAWIAFSPVANHVDAFYKQGATNYFSAIYMLCTIPVGIFAMWAGRYFGLRYAILTAAWTNGLGAIIRLSSSFLPPDFFIPRFYVGLVGQGCSALAYPFIMFLPTRVAAAWFPDNQRALATTIGVMSNPLGVLLASLVSPRIVEHCSQVLNLNIYTAIPSILLTFIATIAIKRSEPPLPPTISAGQQYLDFNQGLRVCLTSKQYMILFLVMGGGIGMFNCLYTVMQQLLCPSGYSNLFSGSMSALLILGGVVGATLAGIFVDRTKLYQETMKVAMGLAVVFGLAFLQLALRSEIGYLIAIACFAFGIFGLATYPVGLQLSAECTFPVSETTSTGLIVISGQIQSIIYLAVMKYFAQPLDSKYNHIEVCSKPVEADLHGSLHNVTLASCGVTEDIVGHTAAITAEDMTKSVLAMSTVAIFLVLVLILTFKPKYRRMEIESGLQLVDSTSKSKKTLINVASPELGNGAIHLELQLPKDFDKVQEESDPPI